MSDPVSPLNGAVFNGFATVREAGPTGMITLRVLPDVPGLAMAFAQLGLKIPAKRRIIHGDKGSAAWMSPDEYLLMMDYHATNDAMATLAAALKGTHHLAVVVSDARAVFHVEGARANQVLRKICPVDFDRLDPMEVRRTRAAQVAAAVWSHDAGYTVVCFRSVASYMMGLLTHSAQIGSELQGARI
jgi:sarcosine oxidase subunit gamma